MHDISWKNVIIGFVIGFIGGSLLSDALGVNRFLAVTDFPFPMSSYLMLFGLGVLSWVGGFLLAWYFNENDLIP